MKTDIFQSQLAITSRSRMTGISRPPRHNRNRRHGAPVKIECRIHAGIEITSRQRSMPAGFALKADGSLSRTVLLKAVVMPHVAQGCPVRSRYPQGSIPRLSCVPYPRPSGCTLRAVRISQHAAARNASFTAISVVRGCMSATFHKVRTMRKPLQFGSNGLIRTL